MLVKIQLTAPTREDFHMLREARIVMPFFATAASLDVHSKLRKALCDTFGGFTATGGQGGWRAPDGSIVQDNVTVYDVAMDGHRDGPYDALARIAIEAGKALNQQSVYVRYCNGNVDIIDIETFVSRADTSAREKAEKEQRLLNALAYDTSVAEHPNAKEGTLRFLEGIFGKGNVVAIDDMGDGRSAEVESTSPPLMPGQLWKTRGGGKAFVGRKATIFGGGFYTTLCDNQPGYRVGFEYAVRNDGTLIEDHDSALDLVSIVA